VNRVLIRTIAVLEIVGGLSGIVFILWSLTNYSLQPLSLAIALFIVGIDVYSLAAGIALWPGTSFGRTASIIIQIIQIPKIFSSTLIFTFSFGVDLWINLLLDERFSAVGFQTSFLASNQLYLNVKTGQTGIGLSLTGATFLFILLKYKPRPATVTLPPPPPSGFAENA